MKTTIKPRFRAQIEHMPLAVTAGACGFRIAYVTEAAHHAVHAQDRVGETPIWFADPSEAYRIMRDAQGATAALLAMVFEGSE